MLTPVAPVSEEPTASIKNKLGKNSKIVSLIVALKTEAVLDKTNNEDRSKPFSMAFGRASHKGRPIASPMIVRFITFSFATTSQI